MIGLHQFSESHNFSTSVPLSVNSSVKDDSVLFAMMLGSSIKRSLSMSSLREQSVTLLRANVPGARYWVNRPLTRRPAGIRRHSDRGAPPPSEGPKASKDSLFSTLLGRYTALLESRPMTTKAITSGAIAFAGDISCQLMAARAPGSEDMLEETQHNVGPVIAPPSKVELDWGRCARFTFLGTTLLAPALHYWYGFLIRRLPGTAVSTVVIRVSLDQLVFTPAFLAVFLSSVMVLDGNAAKVTSKLRADYAATLVGNWGYWIPAQIINFRFIRPVYQVLFSNCCGFFWSIYLSYQSNKALEGTSASVTPSYP